MDNTQQQKTFVLVPGAWMGAWSWFPVARLLQEQGHRVVALTLPGLSYGDSPAGLRLADAVDFVVAEIERRELRDVVLVAHSWGGYPATGAAVQVAEKIAMVIYYNAVVPLRGISMSGENEQYAQATRELLAASPDSTLTLPLEAVRLGMMQDETPELQELVHAMTVPQPGGYMTEPLDVDGVQAVGLPAVYVLGRNDHALARPGDEFAARLGVAPVIVPGSHMAMLSRPSDVAEALVAAADAGQSTVAEQAR